MDYSQFGALMPELIILGLFLVVFLCDTFSNNAKKWLTPVTTVLFAAATVAIWLVPSCAGEAFAGMYVGGTACTAMKSILNLGVFIVLLQSAQWTDSDDCIIRKGEFYELLLVTLFGMYLMISARHFLLFIIGLESASLPLAALVAFNKKRYESHEASLKYIMTAVFSSAILMMGLSFVYALSGTGSLYFTDIAEAVSTSSVSGMLVVALAFLIAGIGYKLSLVPFHLWTADVYQGAPTAVTSYLSVISKGAAAFAFFIIFVQIFGSVYSGVWEWMMYAIIILTITVGNLFAMRQKNMKRFMAFSSVSQAGYIMLGVMAGCMGLVSMMFYICIYVVSNLGAFAVISSIENKTGKVSMDDYDGLHKTNPWLSFAMTLAMFSLAGIPPFAGFFSKILIFASVTSTGSMPLYMLVLVALINTIISLYYYLLVVKAMWINPGDAKIEAYKSTTTERISLWICVAGIVFFGLVPAIYNYCWQAVMGCIG